MDWLNQYWPGILIAVAIVLILFFLLRPRQRVQLTDSTPTRPHMAEPKAPPPPPPSAPKPERGRSIADEMAAATSDVTGDIIDARVHSQLPGASGPPDDLQKLKGVGPKFAKLLNERGIVRFEQIARLTPDEVERLDSDLGPFRGRFQRDRIAEQADYLARGDVDGFEHRFGKL